MGRWIEANIFRPLVSIFKFLGSLLTRDSVREPGYPWFTTNLGPPQETWLGTVTWLSGFLGLWEASHKLILVMSLSSISVSPLLHIFSIAYLIL